MMRTLDFDYELPIEQIAQTPLPKRDDSRMLVLHRQDGRIEHRRFTELPEYLRAGDMMVVNDTRVFPARLFGRKSTGGKVEILLLEQQDNATWRALIGGRGLVEGSTVSISQRDGSDSGCTATITVVLEGAQREIRFDRPIGDHLEALGHTPLPPYIHESLEDAESYQTIYARHAGSAAAPTAGMHFTAELLLTLRDQGVLLENVTLHVGLDTFKPVEATKVQDHAIHTEWARLTPTTAKRINEAKLAGGRLIAVGTTTVRLLETAALRSAGIIGSLQQISRRDADGETSALCPWKPVSAYEGRTDLFIYPGYVFRAVDMMITNFHLPRSSLLMLVAAFAGRETMLAAYQTAVREAYRFYSFGDAMLII